MGQEKGLAVARESANCCNGRVGRQLSEIMQDRVLVKELMLPTGVQILKQTADLGSLAKDTINCCNGRVGKQMAEEILGG